MPTPISITNSTIRNGETRVRVRDYRPGKPSRDALPLLWVHGGGFASGSLRMKESDLVARQIATRAGRWVRTVDYRRVPMWPLLGLQRPRPTPNRFPAARDDVDSAMTDLIDAAGGCVAGGASAGACIVETVRLHRRDEGQPGPAAAVLAYGTFHAQLPPFDAADTRLTAGRRYRFTPESIRTMNLNYAGTEAALAHPDTFPGLRDKSGLELTLMIDADHDLLRASGQTYAAELRAAGVAVTHIVETGSEHGFLNNPQAVGFATGLDNTVDWLASLP